MIRARVWVLTFSSSILFGKLIYFHCLLPIVKWIYSKFSLQNNVCDRDSFQQFLNSSLSGRQQRKTKIEGLARRWGKLLLGGGKNCQDRCDKDKTKKGKRNTEHGTRSFKLNSLLWPSKCVALHLIFNCKKSLSTGYWYWQRFCNL